MTKVAGVSTNKAGTGTSKNIVNRVEQPMTPTLSPPSSSQVRTDAKRTPWPRHTSSHFLIPVNMFITVNDLKKTRPDVLKSRWQRPSNATILRGLYVVTSCLCGFMISWILIYPASWLVGRSSFHEALLETTMGTNDGITSIDIAMKYKGHSLVQFTHNLPGVIWAAAIPFQLHPTLRKQYRNLHRIIGYLFLSTCVIMMVGVVIILRRGLLYEHSFSDLPPLKSSSAPGIVAIGVWFLITAIAAALQARSKKFTSHHRFVIRHVASGIWVALQRAMLITVSALQFGSPFTRLQQRAFFNSAASLSILICLVCGEVAIHLLESEQKLKKIK